MSQSKPDISQFKTVISQSGALAGVLRYSGLVTIAWCWRLPVAIVVAQDVTDTAEDPIHHRSLPQAVILLERTAPP